ncbi:uncharacterized protein OCT59_008806 [Rhizophagus irregularis]|uniref:uncharacterized protein n=1 Tax=Rhizophagus irregularis TaxID=588596 RepID=UPI00332EA80C|nr:hypothetical protein OCT59_008806 [Rhizophagus irregularis]
MSLQKDCNKFLLYQREGGLSTAGSAKQPSDIGSAGATPSTQSEGSAPSTQSTGSASSNDTIPIVNSIIGG